jgi:hypothetical protein
MPAATAIQRGSKTQFPFIFSPPRVNMTTVYGIGKKIDAAPIRLIRNIPKYPY